MALVDNTKPTILAPPKPRLCNSIKIQTEAKCGEETPVFDVKANRTNSQTIGGKKREWNCRVRLLPLALLSKLICYIDLANKSQSPLAHSECLPKSHNTQHSTLSIERNKLYCLTQANNLKWKPHISDTTWTQHQTPMMWRPNEKKKHIRIKIVRQDSHAAPHISCCAHLKARSS